MGKETIRFHVMVPVYKVENYVAECIESVLNQTYQNFELLLMDDGSPDRSGEICEAYAEKDSRVRVFHKENEGLLHTRRRLIAQAGEDGYGVFLDSDDTLAPQALETIAAAIEAYDCDCVIYGGEQVLEGKTLRVFHNAAEETLALRDKRAIYRNILLDFSGDFYSLCRKAARMDVLKKGRDYAPYYHISWGEDRLQSLDIYRHSESVCFIPDVLYHYRVNPTGITRSMSYETFRVDFTVQELEEALLREGNVFDGAELAAYYGGCVCNLADNILMAALLDTSRKNRIDLLKQIRATAFAQRHLDHQYDKAVLGKKALLFELFRRGQYRLLLAATEIYRRIK